MTLIGSVIFHPDCKAQVMGTELLGGEKSKEITFDYSSGFILVKIRLNNFLPLNFIVDTGAEHIILFKKEIADILGFEYEKRIPLIGSDLDREVSAFITRNVGISISDSPTLQRDLIVLEENFLDLESLVGVPIDGILGSRFFRGLIMEINYRKSKLILHDFNHYSPPSSNKFIPIDLEIKNYKPYISGLVSNATSDSIPVKILLDTGSALPFLLILNTHPELQLPNHYIKGNLGRGLGGNLEGFMGIIRELDLSNSIVFNDIVTRFQDIDPRLDPGIYLERNGLLGNPILERFEVILDFISQKLYLKPRKNYNKKFKYDKSGMTVFAFGPRLDQYYIKDVLPGTPASEADFREGDIIKKIGFWSTKFISLAKINKLLQKRSGKKIKFTIERDGKKQKKILILRDLLRE